RPPDRLEQRQVLVAVGIEVGLRQIDAALAREVARGERLAAAVARRPEVAPGEPPVDDLQPGAHHVRDAELARQRLDLVARRGRYQRDRVPALSVGGDERARLGVDRTRDRAREDALGDLLELALGYVAQPSGR